MRIRGQILVFFAMGLFFTTFEQVPRRLSFTFFSSLCYFILLKPTLLYDYFWGISSVFVEPLLKLILYFLILPSLLSIEVHHCLDSFLAFMSLKFLLLVG
jgi:hypothetical protein